MAEISHTPGLMGTHKRNGRKLMVGDTPIAIAQSTPDDPPMAWANARRLSDSWNACDGFDDPLQLRRERDDWMRLAREYRNLAAELSHHCPDEGMVVACKKSFDELDERAKALSPTPPQQDEGAKE